MGRLKHLDPLVGYPTRQHYLRGGVMESHEAYVRRTEEMAECERWLEEQGYVKKPERKKRNCCSLSISYSLIVVILLIVGIVLIIK